MFGNAFNQCRNTTFKTVLKLGIFEILKLQNLREKMKTFQTEHTAEINKSLWCILNRCLFMKQCS